MRKILFSIILSLLLIGIFLGSLERTKSVCSESGATANSAGERTVLLENDNEFENTRAQNWLTKTVDSTREFDRYVDISMDRNNRPHIAYFDDDNDDLIYARYNSTKWETESVDSIGRVGHNLSLALDSFDRPHISYSDITNNDLKYAYYDGNKWINETIDSQGVVGWHTSIAVDSHDHPHISYHKYREGNATLEHLKYAFHDGNQWHNETVDSQGDVGWGSSIAIDSNDRPHIGYIEPTKHHVKYARYDGDVWHNETVDNQGRYYSYSLSLALDSNDLPHMGYYDGWPNTTLRY